MPEPKAGPGRSFLAISRSRRSLLLALGASLLLTACGKKGDLELPPAEPVLGEQAPGLENEPEGGEAQ